MKQQAAEKGCTIIQSCHLKFKRLLGDSKCIVSDDNQAEWLLLVDYNTMEVIFHKSTDSNMSDGEVLLFLKPLEQGMYWKNFKDIFNNFNIQYNKAKKLKKYAIDRRFGLKPQTLYDLKYRIMLESLKFLEDNHTRSTNEQLAAFKIQLMISLISMENKLADCLNWKILLTPLILTLDLTSSRPLWVTDETFGSPSPSPSPPFSQKEHEKWSFSSTKKSFFAVLCHLDHPNVAIQKCSFFRSF